MTIDDMWSLVDLNDYSYEDVLGKLSSKDRKVVENYILKLKGMIMNQSNLAEFYSSMIDHLERKFNSIGLSLNIKRNDSGR